MSIDTSKFLAKENDVRTYLTRPIHLGDYMAFTNGHVICYQPTDCNEVIYDDTPDYTLRRILSLLSLMHRLKEWNPLPKVTFPKKEACYECHGKGTVRIETCQDCDGFGDIDLEHGHHTYTVECKECHGAGQFESSEADEKPCGRCRGNGSIYGSPRQLMIEGVYLDPTYVELIHGVDGVQVCGDADDNMLYFKYGNLLGVIMGMHPFTKREAA